MIELIKGDITYYLETNNSEEISELFRLADRIRERYVGNKVYLRAIIEFSNICRNNCKYCGIRRDANIKRYAMKPKEIVKCAQYAEDLGYGTVVLQSGENSIYDDKMADIVREIKETTKLAVVLSIGEKTYGQYLEYRIAGADRYLLKHETSNPKLFYELTGRNLENRLQCLRWLIDLGYQVGSGNIVGLPGQTIEDLANDLLMFKEWDFDMLGIGPFIPCHGTPLENHPPGDPILTLKVIALARILTKNAHIPATTAIRTVLGDDKAHLIFRCGANVVMGNVTPLEYRKLYRIYPGKVCNFKDPESWLNDIKEQIREAGLKPSGEVGHSLKRRWRLKTLKLKHNNKNFDLKKC